MTNSPERDTILDKCPYCGCEEYYSRGYAKGKVRVTRRFDGELQGDSTIFSIPDNSQMYDELEIRLGKTRWCNDCDRKLPKQKATL